MRRSLKSLHTEETNADANWMAFLVLTISAIKRPVKVWIVETG